MNDRYLYKAKRIDNGEWVEGDLVHSVYKINDTCVGKYGSDVGIHQVCENTICQCTGLKDKNGKLIWENDVVNCYESECFGIIKWEEDEVRFIFDIVLEDLAFEPEDVYDYIDDMEVVGNTFDNPELLEVEE